MFVPRKLREIFSESLNLLSNVPPNHLNQNKFGMLHNHLQEFHTLLHEYKAHDARERLKIHLKSELDQLNAFEQELRG